jgi:hypothetical protein
MLHLQQKGELKMRKGSKKSADQKHHTKAIGLRGEQLAALEELIAEERGETNLSVLVRRGVDMLIEASKTEKYKNRYQPNFFAELEQAETKTQTKKGK